MSKFLKAVNIWLLGGFSYYLIENLWRGFSHPSMFVLGGLCFLLIGGINNFFSWEMGLVWQALIGATVVTVLEFACGLIVNVWLKLGVWDYADMPLDLMGQICLTYSLAWIALSVVAIFFDDFLRWKLYGEEKPRYTLLTVKGR